MDTVTLVQSPSLLNSNLCASDKYLGYISNVSPAPKVVLLDKKTLLDSTGPNLTEGRYKDELPILHINYVSLGNAWFLVLGLENSLQVWNEAGSLLITHISRDDLRLPPSTQMSFQSSTKLGENSIVGGASIGSLHFLRLRNESNPAFDKEEPSQPQHSAPITALTSYGSVVIAGDAMGAVGFWNKLERWTATLLPPCGVPITCCVRMDKLVCFGFAFGQIRVYSILTQKIAFEIGAHARGVTALAAHASTPSLVSVGEDCCVNVWNLQAENLTLLSSRQLPNCVLTGVALYKTGAAVTSYDRLRLYALNDLSARS
jgi:WD40 repeat protein